jgi:hypothetical protein
LVAELQRFSGGYQGKAGEVSRAARFSQADLIRAAEAMRKAGLCVRGAEIAPDGTIRVLTGEANEADDWRKGSPLYQERAA